MICVALAASLRLHFRLQQCSCISSSRFWKLSRRLPPQLKSASPLLRTHNLAERNECLTVWQGVCTRKALVSHWPSVNYLDKTKPWVTDSTAILWVLRASSPASNPPPNGLPATSPPPPPPLPFITATPLSIITLPTSIPITLPALAPTALPSRPALLTLVLTPLGLLRSVLFPCNTTTSLIGNHIRLG